MTYPAPAFLEEDPWFGTPILSEKQLVLKEKQTKIEIKAKAEKVEEPHLVLYERAAKTVKTTLSRDPLPQWMSGAGM